MTGTTYVEVNGLRFILGQAAQNATTTLKASGEQKGGKATFLMITILNTGDGGQKLGGITMAGMPLSP
jgi:hypothetical protein